MHDFDPADKFILVSEFEDLVFNLQRLVVGESNEAGNGLKNRLVYGNSAVRINKVTPLSSDTVSTEAYIVCFTKFYLSFAFKVAN